MSEDWVKITYGTVHNVRNVSEYSLRTLIEAFNINQILEQLNINVKTALDLGCGYGRLTFVLTKFADYVIGLDVRENVIQLAKNTYKDFHNVNFYVYDGKSIPFPDRFFDLVLTNTVLQHVEDIDYLAKEIDRVCGKWLIISEVNKGLTSKGFYPRPILTYLNFFPNFKLFKVFPRYTLINANFSVSGSIIVLLRSP